MWPNKTEIHWNILLLFSITMFLLTCWSGQKPLWSFWIHPRSRARLWPLRPGRLRAASQQDPWSCCQLESCCGSPHSAAQEREEGQHVHRHTPSNNSSSLIAFTYKKCPASSVSAGYQATLGGRQRNVELLLVQQKRASYSYWHWHVANDILTASAHHLQVRQITQTE